MKKKIFYVIVPVLGFSLLGVAGIASARGMGGGIGNMTLDEIVIHHEAMFEQNAKILGISVDEMKSKWAEGKTMREIAEEKGISQETIRAKMKELRVGEMKLSLQSLVSKGVITQVQADQRLKFMEQNTGNRGKSKLGGDWMRGRGMMF